MEVLKVNPVGDRELFQYATRHLSVRFVSVVETLRPFYIATVSEDEKEMDEKDLELARAMVDAKLDGNSPQKTVVSRMHDKQKTFR
ncbi:nad kinase-like protein [Lasius niger]|uniref:Nad kinase-like protein n=1 Tax=Lasius niger TaxID=67767 RepID=A0A0J7L3V8_LASNI|nr:nad kinase-like protein [Lasius niger]